MRVVVATADALGPQQAGPAIRALEFATALSAEHDVSLLTTGRLDLTPEAPFRVGRLTDPVPGTDVYVVQGSVLRSVPGIADSDACLVVDLYDPYHLEKLEFTRDQALADRQATVHNATAVLNEAMQRGDFFLVASERQRDFWLGALASLGRVNPLTYDADSTLRRLVEVVPFGVSPTPPVATRPALRGVVPGIGADDVVLLWGGGIYNWFDPETLIRAVDVVRREHDAVRLVFLGTAHPDPDVAAMRAVVAATRLSAELGLTDKHVFFNQGWVPYADRGSFFLDSDIGVSTHHEHVETAFSFRTRILDYLWAGLPVVSTSGDVLSAQIASSGAGRAVPPGDVEALATALGELVEDVTVRQACSRAARQLASTYQWDAVVQPLLTFCRAPERAPDLRDEMARRLQAQPLTTVRAPRSAPGLRGELDLARSYLRQGGVGLLSRRVLSRSTALLRRQP